MSFSLLYYATWTSYNKPVALLLDSLVYSLFLSASENIILSEKLPVGISQSQNEERHEDNYSKIDKQIGKASVKWVF